jgi:hypothetical protein
VGEELVDDQPLEDGRDDLELSAAAVRAVRHVDVEDALEPPGLTDSFGATRSGQRMSHQGRQ